MTVPASKVTLAIPADSLRRLPDGASYHGRSGQASLSVKGAKTADGAPAIIVEASCDSLQLQCERYEYTIRTMEESYAEQLRRLNEELEAAHTAEEIREKPPNGILTAIKWLLTGVVVGLAAGTLGKLRINN